MITTCVTNAARLAFLRGDIRPNHVFKIALYTKKANLGKKTEKYTKLYEVDAQGYAVKRLVVPEYGIDEKNDTAYLEFKGDIVWSNSTISADGCLVFDETLDNLALIVQAFPSTISSTNDAFTLSPETELIKFR